MERGPDRDLEPLGGRLALLTINPLSGTTLLDQVLDRHSGGDQGGRTPRYCGL